MSDQQTGGSQSTPLSRAWWQTRTAWTSIAGIVVSGGAILALILHDQKWAVGAASLAGLLGNVGSVLARSGGVDAAVEVGARSGVLTDEEAAAAPKAPATNEPNPPPVS